MKKLLTIFGISFLFTANVQAQDEIILLEDFDYKVITDQLLFTTEDLTPVEIDLEEVLVPADEVDSYHFEFISQFSTIEQTGTYPVDQLNTRGMIVEDDDTLEIIEIDTLSNPEQPFRYGDLSEEIAMEYLITTNSYLDLYDYGMTTHDLILYRYPNVYEMITTFKDDITVYENDDYYVLDLVTTDSEFGSALDAVRSITLGDYEPTNMTYGLYATINKETGLIHHSLITTGGDIRSDNFAFSSELYSGFVRHNETESIYDENQYSEAIETIAGEQENQSTLQYFFEDNPGHSNYLTDIFREVDTVDDSDTSASEILDNIEPVERYEFALFTDLTVRDNETNGITSQSASQLQGYVAEEDDFLSVQGYLATGDGTQLIRYGNTEQDVVWLNDSLEGGTFQDTSQYGVDEVIYFRYNKLLEELQKHDNLIVQESSDFYFLSLENDEALKETFDTLQYTFNDPFEEGTDSYGIVTMVNKDTNTLRDTVMYRKMNMADGSGVSYLEILSGFRENTEFEDTLDPDTFE